MSQHFLTDGRNTESICGTDMVGQRNPALDTDDGATDCIACLSILAGKPLYEIDALDEDGYHDRRVLKSATAQFEAAQEAFDKGALQVTMRILSVDMLKAGEW